MSPSEYAYIGGIAGAVIGLLGGVVGTYFSLRNTLNRKERAFVIKAATTLWLALLLVMVAAYIIPSPYRILAFVPVWIALPFAIIYWNRQQNALRRGGD